MVHINLNKKLYYVNVLLLFFLVIYNYVTSMRDHSNNIYFRLDLSGMLSLHEHSIKMKLFCMLKVLISMSFYIPVHRKVIKLNFLH